MATPSLNLTRDQLAEFLKDHDQIKQFEALFSIVRTLAPILNIDFETGGDTAGASANDALAQAAITESALQPLQTAPLPQQSNSISADYLDFNAAPPHVERIRRLSWSESNETCDLGMGSGIVHQVGQQYFARVENETAVNISKGQVCYWVGSTALGNFSVEEYDAISGFDSKKVLGLSAAELIAGGDPSSVICWGRLDGLDTTGAAVGETWAAGDQLYASDSVLGGLTNVQPVPSLSLSVDIVPMATVLSVNATTGALFVRPQPKDLYNFGGFSRIGDQVLAAANTAYAIVWNNPFPTRQWLDLGAGVLNAQIDSDYEIKVTVSVTSTTAANKNIWIWLRKAGVNVASSAQRVTLTLANETTSVFLNSRLYLAGTDNLEVMIASDAVGVTVDYFAATAFAPAVYAATIYLNPVSP